MTFNNTLWQVDTQQGREPVEGRIADEQAAPLRKAVVPEHIPAQPRGAARLSNNALLVALLLISLFGKLLFLEHLSQLRQKLQKPAFLKLLA